MRAALAVGVMFPQIVFGALITFAGFDLYPYYNLCGRLFASIGAIDDQQIGGIVIWIPPAMMSILAMILALNALMRNLLGAIVCGTVLLGLWAGHSLLSIGLIAGIAS